MIKQHISCQKTCLFILLFIFLAIFLFGIPLLCTVLILKPQMPEFSVQEIHVKSYKLNVNRQNLIVSSVLSLNLRAENPNKVGLTFGYTKFHVLSEGLVVGLIRIPQFHQPPRSKNVSIQTRASFECVNVSEILNGNSKRSGESKGVFGVRILGDVRAQVRIFNITLPKIKVALDCGVNVSNLKFGISNEFYSMRRDHNHLDLISLPLNTQTVSKKCSLAILL